MIKCPRCQTETAKKILNVAGIEITKHTCAGCDSAFYFDHDVLDLVNQLTSKKQTKS